METLGLAVLALLALVAVLTAASVPLLWYVIAALLFFIGWIGPGLGCLLLGLLIHGFWAARDGGG